MYKFDDLIKRLEVYVKSCTADLPPRYADKLLHDIYCRLIADRNTSRLPVQKE